MKKSLIKLSAIFLLIILTVLSFAFTLTVNAQTNNLNQGRNIAPNIGTDEIMALNLDEEKIMEYDATTDITKEVKMDEIRKSAFSNLARSGGNNDRIEPYDPLNNDNTNNSITPYAIYNAVSDVTAFPYRTTCRIKADVYGNVLVGSGYIAGPKIVVTAAHCVMNIDDNDAFFDDWVAYPGYKNGTSYNGVSSGWSKVYYPSNWKSTHSPACDWCICILNSDIGNTTGWYGSQSYGTNEEMNNVSVRLLGYPLSVGNAERQYYTNGTISNTQDYYFDSSAKTVGGFSGGPFVRNSDNYVVGICHGYWNNRPDISIGVRITQNMIDIIRENS